MKFCANPARTRKPKHNQLARTPTETTSAKQAPNWKVERLGLSSVFFVCGRILDGNTIIDKVLTATDGRIFFATAKAALAIIDRGQWKLKINNTETDLAWNYLPSYSLHRTLGSIGKSFQLKSYKIAGELKYGSIGVKLYTDFHAKIAILPDGVSFSTDIAWEAARTVEIKDLYAELTVLWFTITGKQRLLAISKRSF